MRMEGGSCVKLVEDLSLGLLVGSNLPQLVEHQLTFVTFRIRDPASDMTRVLDCTYIGALSVPYDNANRIGQPFRTGNYFNVENSSLYSMSQPYLLFSSVDHLIFPQTQLYNSG